MSEEKKSPLEVAMEKDCIFLVIAKIIVMRIAEALGKTTTKISTECRGPKCAEFDQFNSRCGFSK